MTEKASKTSKGSSELLTSKLIKAPHYITTRGFDLNKIDFRQVVTAEQVHSNRVAVVGKTDLSKTIPGADALITAEKEVALAVRTADCVPVFLYDDKTPAVGLVHAGWRGTAMNITAKTLRTMEKEFGSRPEDVKAWIGPCIKACCYDCDLVELNLYQLIGSGIEAERVEVSPLCTGCEQSLFYSYRRDGSGTGRLYSLISIPI